MNSSNFILDIQRLIPVEQNIKLDFGPSLMGLLKKLLAPQLHVNPPDNFIVDQGHVAISTGRLKTGSFGPCLGIAMTHNGINFCAHIDATTDPKWLSECIGEYAKILQIDSRSDLNFGLYNANEGELNKLALDIVIEACRLAKANCTVKVEYACGMETLAVQSSGISFRI